MRVLIACEFSGIVREAFARQGHDAYSCDLLDTEIPTKNHIKGNVLDILNDGWKLMIAHPPCRYLAVSGARYFAERESQQLEALEFVRKLMDAPIERICIENPISIISTKIRKPDQIIHPWMFGHEESKATCLWLKNLPKLMPTKIMDIKNRNRTPTNQNNIGPSPDRWKRRSRTYFGVAEAMAVQWHF